MSSTGMQYIQGNDRHQAYFGTLEDQVGKGMPLKYRTAMAAAVPEA
jgi:hypothetical protein